MASSKEEIKHEAFINYEIDGVAVMCEKDKNLLGECIDDCMEKYAKQIGVEILKKMSFHSKIYPLDDNYWYDGVDTKEKNTYEELYNFLITTKSQQSS